MAVKAMKLFEDVYGLEATEMFKESLLSGWKTGEEEAGVTAVVWDHVPYVGGAFRMVDPGQHEKLNALTHQGRGGGNRDNGLYLAGEALANYGPEWMD